MLPKLLHLSSHKGIEDFPNFNFLRLPNSLKGWLWPMQPNRQLTFKSIPLISFRMTNNVQGTSPTLHLQVNCVSNNKEMKKNCIDDGESRSILNSLRLSNNLQGNYGKCNHTQHKLKTTTSLCFRKTTIYRSQHQPCIYK